MEAVKIRELIRQELPKLIVRDRELQELVRSLSRQEFSNREQTEDRFEKMLVEIRAMREESERKWRENQAEQNRKWNENQAEQNRKWEEQNRKWDESRKEFDRVHEEIMAIAKKTESSIGALGARWGMQSEQAFRNGLAAILEKSFGVQVINYQDYDDSGMVFGQPDQIEMDVIVRNGTLILCELKSSLSRSEVYTFKRKADFYETKHQRKADRLLAISPMVDDRARVTAQKLGIELYTHSLDVVP